MRQCCVAGPESIDTTARVTDSDNLSVLNTHRRKSEVLCTGSFSANTSFLLWLGVPPNRSDTGVQESPYADYANLVFYSISQFEILERQACDIVQLI